MKEVDYVRAMYGENAVQVPINLIAQHVSDDGETFAGVWQSRNADFGKLLKEPPCKGSAHVMLLGDAVIRPRVIMKTNHMVGYGIGGIYRDGFASMDEWIKHGEMVFEI